VTSPNGGESWQRGTTHAITWNKTGSIANVKIVLNYGSTSETVTTSTPNTGSYSWTIPKDGVLSSNCKIYVSDAAGSGASDSSNSTSH